VNLLGNPKEQRTQLYFRDDGSFIFRKFDVEDGFLVERKGSDNEVAKAWMMKYKLLQRFNGYKGIGADMVTLSFGRDILLDPFDKLNINEKPEKGASLIKEFVRKIAEAKCYRHEMKAKGNNMADKLVLFMGSVMVLLAIGMGIAAVY